jgi:hypothetical protein
MDDPTSRVALHLHPAAVLVLFDWLMSVDVDAVPTSHRSQKQALMDLLTAIEVDTVAPDAPAAEIALAQEVVARDMGWS